MTSDKELQDQYQTLQDTLEYLSDVSHGASSLGNYIGTCQDALDRTRERVYDGESGLTVAVGSDTFRLRHEYAKEFIDIMARQVGEMRRELSAKLTHAEIVNNALQGILPEKEQE